MKYEEITDYSFLLDKDHYVYDHSETDSLDIFIKSRKHSCPCPQCQTESCHLHATYVRKIQDVPIRCKPTYLHVNVYKYECDNPECETKVFTEPLSFARASQVRTDALNTLILGMAMFMSNEGASNVLKLLGVTVSNDTIQRLYDRIGFVDDPDVEAVGIDDVATRKGQTYATVIYDLKDHHMIALLDGRDGITLKEWLKQHKKIRVAARDRASAYAKAISEVLPECVQVADRFHLLQNLVGHLKDLFKKELPNEIFIRNGQILDAPPEKVSREKKVDEKIMKQLHYDNTQPVDENGNPVEYDDSANDYNSKKYKQRAQNRKKTGADMGNPENVEGNAGERPPFPLQQIQNKQVNCK